MNSWLGDSGRRGLARRATVVVLDAGAAALALVVALLLRTSGDVSIAILDALPLAMLATAAITGFAFSLGGIYSRAWRYFSMVDLYALLPAATLAVIGTAVARATFLSSHWLPISLPIIQWFIFISLLAGMRLARRSIADRRAGNATNGVDLQPGALAGPLTAERPQRVLLVGSMERVEIALRSIERNERDRCRVVGIIDQEGRSPSLKMRGVPVLGALDAVEQIVNRLDAVGHRPESIFIVDGPAAISGPEMVRLVSKAEFLGLKVGRIAQSIGVEANNDRLDLRFIDTSALLDRTQVVRDLAPTRLAITGRRVLVTGAGGTIGSELVRQIAALEPDELVLLDHAEINLYNIDLEMQENFPGIKRSPVLVSIRQRECLMKVFETFRPELVFHAAALKHVPLVEVNPCAGVLTNVLGTRNVADAARRHGARAMVQVSTDKAVNPVGIMGATKRLGELYCQALDLAGEGDPASPRFVTVRFGNVLGSSGSLIPLFQRQLARRGPLTVTHAEIERFFMTVHEAVHLILQSTAKALDPAMRRGRIFVLDMGAPVKIIDVARRMIRLAGLEPDVDVKIKVVGLRPGEKLYEELFDTGEERFASTIPGILEAAPMAVPYGELQGLFDRLETESLADNVDFVRQLVLAAAEPKPAAAVAKPIAALQPVATVQPVAVAQPVARAETGARRRIAGGIAMQGAGR